MEQLNHPNLIRMLETIDSPKRVHIVMEYAAKGNLHAYLKVSPVPRKPSRHPRVRLRLRLFQCLCAAQMRDLTDDVPHALRAKRLFQPRGACSHIRGRAEIRRNYRLVARRDQAVRRHRMYSTADGKATT